MKFQTNDENRGVSNRAAYFLKFTYWKDLWQQKIYIEESNNPAVVSIFVRLCRMLDFKIQIFKFIRQTYGDEYNNE